MLLKNLKKLTYFLGLALILNVFVLPLFHHGIDNIKFSFSQTAEAFQPVEKIREIGDQTGLPDFDTGQGTHPDAPSNNLNSGVGTATSPILFAIDLIKLMMSGIAMIIVVMNVIKMITSSAEDTYNKSKDAMIWGVLGLVIIQVADFVVKQMFFGEQGDAFESIASVEIYADQSSQFYRGVIGFVQFGVGAIATLFLVVRGFILISSVGNEEEITKARTHVLYSLLGLIIVGISEVVIELIVFPDNGGSLPSVDRGQALIKDLTNFGTGFIAIIAFLVLVYSGYLYVVQGSQDDVVDKVKKNVIGAVIAILLAGGAFAIVNSVITLDDTERVNEVNQ